MANKKDIKYPYLEYPYKIPEGYHPRLSGAAISIMNGYVDCDVCHQPKTSLEGFEKDYPNNPDIWVCSDCVIANYHKCVS